MKSYFIGTNVQGGIPGEFVPVGTAFKYKGIQGILCDSQVVDEKYEVRTERTDMEGVENIIFISPKIAKVTVGDWNGCQREAFLRITEEKLLPYLERDIKISVPHGRNHEVPEEGPFRIYIWSSPIGERSINPPNKVWGIHVSCRDAAFAPSGKGIPIIADDGYVVGEYIEGKALYIHHDICEDGKETELLLYEKILVETIAFIFYSPEERLLFKKKQSEKAFVAEMSKRFEKTLTGTKKSLEEANSSIKRLMEEYTRKVREAQGLTKKIEQLVASHTGDADKFLADFERICQIPKVTGIEVYSGKIVVFTETLFCKNEGKTYEIGAFRIEIFTNGSNNGVHWYNLTRRVDGYREGMNAPHVFPDGHACLGTIEGVVPELIATYQYDVLIMLAIQFIEAVNTDDSAGKYVSRWPLVGGEA